MVQVCWDMFKYQISFFFTHGLSFKVQWLTAMSCPPWTARSIVDSFPSHFCSCTSLPLSRVKTVWKSRFEQGQRSCRSWKGNKVERDRNYWGATFVFRPSAVVSSNSSSSLNVISMFLKVLWDFTVMTPLSFTVTTKSGLAAMPIFLRARFTPAMHQRGGGGGVRVDALERQPASFEFASEYAEFRRAKLDATRHKYEWA